MALGYPQHPVGISDQRRNIVGVADEADARAVIAEHHAHGVVAEIVNFDAEPTRRLHSSLSGTRSKFRNERVRKRPP
jgi:hypothetical protein